MNRAIQNRYFASSPRPHLKGKPSRLRSFRAESLVETLIAITVIVISTTAALSLLRTSLTGNNVIGEKVVALNLGLEAIEAMKNIRDTNYLRFASDPDNCWNKLDAEDVDDCSDGTATEIDVNVTYYLQRDLSDELFKWNLLPAGTNDGFLDLYEYTLNDGSTVELYAQTGVDPSTGFSSVQEEAYFRTITIDNVSTNADTGLMDSYDATVYMEWTVRGDTKSMELTRTIANVY